MKATLHILHLEDNPNDAALVQSELEAAGLTCDINRVESRAVFVAALERGGIDLVFSDFTLPAFDGLSALNIVHTRWPDLPVILISGTLGEEKAVAALKSGATDYILKGHLARLAPAVRRAMQEAGERAERRRTATVLQETEQRFEILFSESVLGIALVGADGHPFLANAALQKMLGYTNEELSRIPFIYLAHPDDFETDRELYQQLLEGARKSYQIENRFLGKDGRVVWVRLSVSVAREAKEAASFSIAMIEDISERRKLEARFIEAQKMEVIGQLAGGVAHDFNNILAVIMGYTDFIVEALSPDSPVQKYAEEIRHASERAAGLTRQLLVFSRKQSVQPVVLDLNVVVQDLNKMLLRLIDENIESTIVPGKRIGRIKADPGYVGQVLMNLVVNARDAMPNGGKLTITTQNLTLDENDAQAHPDAPPGDYVMLSVSDTGTGMTEEVKAHLFEAFFTTKAKGKGTGLGLATCRTIVQQSGGHLGVYSKLGEGTIFKIYFPRVEQPLDVSARPTATGPLPRGTETLLVVEDEPAVRHLARKVLQTQGYEVLSAANGQDGLHEARAHKGAPIRLVVTDVIMPLMGGKVMAEWLKTTYPELKILFTSGYTDDAITQLGVLEPGLAFLPKPYTPETLARKVRSMLDNETDTAFLQKGAEPGLHGALGPP